jgi:hypothetical protein
VSYATTPSPDVAPFDETTDADNAAGESERLDYPDPIEHGHGNELVLNDHDGRTAYRRLWEAWREHVSDPDEEPFVLVEDVHERWDWLHDEYPAHLVLSSKGWKVGTEANGNEITRGKRYEYSVQVMRYDEDGDLDDSLRAPVSCQTWVQPQDESLVYKSGDRLICQYGEGTKFRTQTTYAGPQETLVRTVQVMNAALEAVGKERPDWTTVNRDSWRVWKGEVHHRLDEELMNVVVNKLRSARTLVEHGGDGDASGGGRYDGGQHVEERVVSDMWDRIGFAGYAGRSGYNLGLKVYRITGHPADERLRHPKLEAFFGGTDNETKLPHADEWQVLRATLRQMVSTFAIRSGVSLADLRDDDYYVHDDREMIETVVPTGWRKAMLEANEVREAKLLKTTYESLSKAKWDILWTVAVTEGCSYDMLEDITGFGYDYIREVVHELEEMDILLRITYPRIVVYHNEELRLNAIEKLQEVHPDRGLDDIRADGDDRQQRREERAESDADDQSDDDDGVQDTPTAEETADSGMADSETWRLFRDVLLNGDQLGRALDEAYIEPEDVKIRTDPYPEFFG